jgi:hypothetical protein
MDEGKLFEFGGWRQGNAPEIFKSFLSCFFRRWPPPWPPPLLLLPTAPLLLPYGCFGRTMTWQCHTDRIDCSSGGLVNT